MATFTEAQITDLAEILGTNSDLLSTHLDFYESLITDADKTAILARVTDYQAVEDKDLSIMPTESNFGAKIGSSEKRSLIRKRIAALLSWQGLDSGNRLIRTA